ncbi:MAG: EAL domain-containing protein [Clostridia bacterium]|nr:EAL domain-containing protein [Clostridia bacterium]
MITDALIHSTRRTVLIVEDEAVNRDLLGIILKGNYDVLYASDGLEALEILETYPGRVAMILLDILMPRMDGIEFLRRRGADEALSRIPVIVLTSDKDAELETLKMGALDFIAKPYDMPEIILARIQRIIEFVEDRQIIQEVERDELTGLYTRGFFFEYSRRLQAAQGGELRDVIAVDVDHFRLVNEVYGKGFGDELLCAVADGIWDELRGGFGIACRGDVDLFYVYLNQREDYEAVYSRLMDRVHALGRQTNVRLRMGVYRGVEADRPLDWYCVAAKAACDTIRGNYARSVVVYDSTMHERELYNERLIADMETAIAEKQFVVYYQPKYDIRGDVPKLYSAEALVRWIHPELGFISPGAFIPLFEENGLISKLDDFVWREAAAQIRDWQDRLGICLPVSVNISRMDFFDTDLKRKLLEIVAENGIPVDSLVLEVTESAYSQNMERMLKTVGELREAGFRIEMDDFGSGYSSLNMLCVMPIDALKIDMKFVRNVVNSGVGYRMVELVVEMARALDVPAVVEGVEDEAQYQMIKRVGCDIIQGYYFSRPVPPEDFEPMMKKDR